MFSLGLNNVIDRFEINNPDSTKGKEWKWMLHSIEEKVKVNVTFK